MIFHLVLNTFLVFTVLALSIELFLFIFGIQNSRIRYCCRILPIIKIPFDFFIFALYGDSLFVNLNPFSCEIYLQEFITNLFPSIFSTPFGSDRHLIIPEYIAMQIPYIWLQIFIIGTVIISCLAISWKIYQFLSSNRFLKKVLLAAIPCSKPIFNSQLQTKLNNLNAVILTSTEINIPFAANQRYIIFPADLLDKFSQNEFEAVIAHEVEHLIWKDPIFKLLCSITCSVFWWIPSAWWLKRLEADQEQASDFGINRYSIDTFALASALLKVVNQSKYLKCRIAAICPLDSPKSSHTERLDKILNSNKLPLNKICLISYSIGLFLCVLCFFSFWMC
jgi:hypothetical protein